MSQPPKEPFFAPLAASGDPRGPKSGEGDDGKQKDGPVRTQMVGEAPGEDPGYDPGQIPTEPIPDEDDD